MNGSRDAERRADCQPDQDFRESDQRVLANQAPIRPERGDYPARAGQDEVLQSGCPDHQLPDHDQ